MRRIALAITLSPELRTALAPHLPGNIPVTCAVLEAHAESRGQRKHSTARIPAAGDGPTEDALTSRPSMTTSPKTRETTLGARPRDPAQSQHPDRTTSPGPQSSRGQRPGPARDLRLLLAHHLPPAQQHRLHRDTHPQAPAAPVSKTSCRTTRPRAAEPVVARAPWSRTAARLFAWFRIGWRRFAHLRRDSHPFAYTAEARCVL